MSEADSGLSFDDDATLRQLAGRSALVTGGMGFIGSNLARALVGLGCNVTVLDCLEPGEGGNRFNLAAIEARIDLRIADIRDEAAVGAAVEGRDYVFNLAGGGRHLDSLADPFRDLDVNLRGSLIVLEAVRRLAPQARVVFGGTRSEYGLIQSTPVTEEHPLRPTEINSADKAAVELYHFAYHVSHGLSTVTLRLPNVYGPRMQMEHPRQGFLNWFVRTVIEDGTIRLFGDGTQVRDLVYIDDVVRAHLLAALMPDAAGEAFNVGSGDPSRLVDVAEALVQIAGKGRIEYVPFPDDARRIEIGDYVADVRKIRRMLGWQMTTTLREGLEGSVRYYEKYREHYW